MWGNLRRRPDDTSVGTYIQHCCKENFPLIEKLAHSCGAPPSSLLRRPRNLFSQSFDPPLLFGTTTLTSLPSYIESPIIGIDSRRRSRNAIAMTAEHLSQ